MRSSKEADTSLIDYLAIGLTHGLIAYVAIRLLVREDLDDEKAFDMPEPEPLFKKRKRRKPLTEAVQTPDGDQPDA